MEEGKQRSLFENQTDYEVDGPVICLGLVFASDDDRRRYFMELLREKLQDPEFRAIEGFPIGEDEDILALSDPPYYTACPNPWIPDFIELWEAEKPAKTADDKYHREPFAADVSEGKNNPIYNAHSYHTKVPHKAIMRYILHYTSPGDIVFDGFCGTGMTGVATALCNELGSDRTPGSLHGEKGSRNAILIDLSPIATFIAGNLLRPLPRTEYQQEIENVSSSVESRFGHLYRTRHTGWKVRERKTIEHKRYARPHSIDGTVEFTLYSDLVRCPECGFEVPFYDIAVDESEDKLRKQLKCPNCDVSVSERDWEGVFETVFDPVLGQAIRQLRIVPVIINYSVGSTRFEKSPDEDDLTILDEAKQQLANLNLSAVPLIEGKETQRNVSIGITHLHQFFTPREHLFVAALLDEIKQLSDIHIRNSLLFALTASLPYASRLRRFRADRKGGGPLSGTLYVSSLVTPPNVLHTFRRNAATIADSLGKAVDPLRRHNIGTQSADCLPNVPSDSIDYIFTDPPFGHNFDYSELNFYWEGLLKVRTDQDPEAIVSGSQKKGLDEYRILMERCFKEYHRILKPGRWITVEFSNTKASVWNSIQTALGEAGLIVANVSALDKKQGSFKAVTTPTAVKQDLVISAYKPNGGFAERFSREVRTEAGVWDFIRTHLSYIPVVKRQNGSLQMILERDPRILFDQMVAYYVRNGYPVPLSSQEFQVDLAQRFPERDGMFFLPEQVAEYDRTRLTTTQLVQESLFVSDEDSAIRWLRQLLKEKPQIFSDINPQYMQQLGGWNKHEEQIDLRELLNQNFLRYDGQGEVPSQIHSYLSSNYRDMRNLAKDDPALQARATDRWYVPDPNKGADLEKLREKGLLREFEEYRNSKQRRLKVFRMEAMRAGFKKAWQEGDYETIVAVARKIPDKILHEDPKLLMWYDQALTRTGQME